MKRAQNSGTTVIATTYEANSARTTAAASAENKNRLTPYRKVTGKKTTAVVSVVARAESGIEKKTATVARMLPRKIRIMSEVRNNPMPPSCSSVEMAVFTKRD